MVGNRLIHGRIDLVHHHMQEIETGQDGGRQIDVVLERLGAVIAASQRIGCSKNGCPRIQCCLNSSFSNRDRLLLHGLVDGDLQQHMPQYTCDILR